MVFGRVRQMIKAIENWLFLWGHYKKPELYCLNVDGSEMQIAFNDHHGDTHAIPWSCVLDDQYPQLDINLINIRFESRPAEDLGFKWEFETQMALYFVPVAVAGQRYGLEIKALNEGDALHLAEGWAKAHIGEPVLLGETDSPAPGLIKAEMIQGRKHIWTWDADKSHAMCGLCGSSLTKEDRRDGECRA